MDDKLGRVHTETVVVGSQSLVRTSDYDGGLLLRKIDRKGRATVYAYDNLGRQTFEYWYATDAAADADTDRNDADYTLASTYNAVGALVSAEDDVAAYSYTYDDLSRVLTETQDFADSPTVVLSYVYDGAGRRTQVAATVGGTADYVNDYSYDDLGRATRIEQHGVQGGNAVAEKRVDLSYDAAGQYATIAYYNDLDGGTANLVMTAAYSYDDVGRLTSLVYTDSSSTTIRDFSGTYNGAGWITSHDSDVYAEDVTAYSYDDLGQLLGATYADSDTESYTYDAAGNRIAANGDIYTTGDANRTTGDGTYKYIYDDEGNLVYKYKDTTGSPSGLDSADTDVTEYSWDNRNRLKEVVHRATFGGDIDWTAKYKYDALNHRISSSYDNNADGTPDRVERYVWDGEGIVLDFVDADGGNNSLNDGTTSAPLSLATRYLWGTAVDQLLAQETGDDGSADDVSHIVRDNLGSTRSLVNSDGDLAATYTYDTYGNVTASPSNATDTRFLYTCQEYDLRLGLYYYNARWYDPAIGKFVSEDPIGYEGGINLNEYVGDNPLIRIDPFGLKIHVENPRTDGTFSGIANSNAFASDVLSALQAVIGDCAKLRLTNKKETLLWGTNGIKHLDSADIEYYDENPSCKNNPCWQALKKTLGADKTFNVNATAGGNQYETNNNTAYVNPNKRTIVWEIQPGGWLLAVESSFAASLWHELVCHGGLGQGQHPATDSNGNQNVIDPNSKCYDPTIGCENQARKCLKQGQRVHQYYPTGPIQDPTRPGQTQPYPNNPPVVPRPGQPGWQPPTIQAR